MSTPEINTESSVMETVRSLKNPKLENLFEALTLMIEHDRYTGEPSSSPCDDITLIYNMHVNFLYCAMEFMQGSPEKAIAWFNIAKLQYDLLDDVSELHTERHGQCEITNELMDKILNEVFTVVRHTIVDLSASSTPEDFSRIGGNIIEQMSMGQAMPEGVSRAELILDVVDLLNQDNILVSGEAEPPKNVDIEKYRERFRSRLGDPLTA